MQKALSDGLVDGTLFRSKEMNGYATIPISSSASVSSPSLFGSGGANFIEHRVSKMDTLAGVAIKYGVEVADIRRMNGLVTDIQMFARQSLQIPLPGRHPPSPGMSNGSNQSGDKTRRHQSHDILDSVRSLKPKPSPRPPSPAMSTLQGYYGLTQSNKTTRRLSEGTEMSVFKSGKTLTFEHENTHTSTNGFSPENANLSKNIKEHTPEILLKEEGNGGLFSGRAVGKGLALRPKLGSRTDLDDSGGGDCLIAEAPLSVRKSSSASSLIETENVSSIWPTSKWSLKPEVIARPIFDGFQKPLAAWRNKAALD